MPKYAFHYRYPTEAEHELWLADKMAAAIELRYGNVGARLQLRRDAAGVFRRMRYHRIRQRDIDGERWAVVMSGMNYRSELPSRAGADEILTPADKTNWRKLVDQVEAGDVGDMMTHDPGDRSRTVAAVRQLGFAVAETLATIWFFDGECDWAVVDGCEECWFRSDQRHLNRFPDDSFDRMLPIRKLAAH